MSAIEDVDAVEGCIALDREARSVILHHGPFQMGVGARRVGRRPALHGRVQMVEGLAKALEGVVEVVG